MDETLNRFIGEAIGGGFEKSEIERILIEAGWPQDEVRKGLTAFADVDFPIPVPRPKAYLSAREAFLYLVLFTFLYSSAWSLGSVVFEIIHRVYPDPAAPRAGGYSVGALRWGIAMLLTSFPGYLALSRRSYLAARHDPDRRRSKVRKWLTYLTLFIAASTLLGDAISLLYNLLEGELTLRFVLKVLTVGVIAGAVFGYYLWDLRQDDLPSEVVPARRPGLRLLVAGVTAAVVVSLVSGMVAAGSPVYARAVRLDGERERNLRQIAAAIDRYSLQFNDLPQDLETLDGTRGFSVPAIRDPETGAPYEYSVDGERSYEICAIFATSTRTPHAEPAEGRPGSPLVRYMFDDHFWRHDEGRNCFEIEVQDKST
jgi:hypothetical protein